MGYNKASANAGIVIEAFTDISVDDVIVVDAFVSWAVYHPTGDCGWRRR